MTITEKIQALLSAPGTVTALVPASRIRVPGDWQNLARPYIIHRPVSEGMPEHAHGAKMSAWRIWEFYQVSIFADTYASGDAIAQAVRLALVGIHGGVHIFYRGGPWYVGQEPDTLIHHFALDFRILEALT